MKFAYHIIRRHVLIFQFQLAAKGMPKGLINHRRPKLTIREIDRINDLCKRMNDLCKRMSDLCKRFEWDVTT